MFNADAARMKNAKTQEDIVNENTPPTPERLTEPLELPGLAKIHLMSESEMEGFFMTVLKSRPHIYGLELTLGRKYEQKEELARVPYANKLAGELSPEKIARLLVAVLAGNSKAVGFNAKIEQNRDGNPTSNIYVKIANKKPTGPTWNDDGVLVAVGDEEFEPELLVTYKPLHL